MFFAYSFVSTIFADNCDYLYILLCIEKLFMHLSLGEFLIDAC